MKLRLVLLIILWFAVSYYLPDTRVWLKDATQVLWNPVVKWNAEEEMKQVGRDVINQEQMAGRIPDRRDWLPWLDYRYNSDDLKKDPWGTTYELVVWADSIAIMSYGPDRVRATEDDFHVMTPRPRRRR